MASAFQFDKYPLSSILELKSPPDYRANGAKDASPGQRPG